MCDSSIDTQTACSLDGYSSFGCGNGYIVTGSCTHDSRWKTCGIPSPDPSISSSPSSL